jgi:hypothetical protein
MHTSTHQSKSPFNKRDRVRVVASRKPEYNGMTGTVIHAGKSTGRVTIEFDDNKTQWFDFYPTSLEKVGDQ